MSIISRRIGFITSFGNSVWKNRIWVMVYTVACWTGADALNSRAVASISSARISPCLWSHLQPGTQPESNRRGRLRLDTYTTSCGPMLDSKSVHVTCMHVTCLIHMFDVTHSCMPPSYVGRDSFMYATCLIHACDIFNSCVWHVPHSCMGHASFINVTSLIHACGMPHSHMWRDWFMFMTCLIHVCGIPYSCMWHTLLIYVTWLMLYATCLVHVCDISHSWIRHVIYMQLNEACYIHEWVTSHIWMRVCRCNKWRASRVYDGYKLAIFFLFLSLLFSLSIFRSLTHTNTHGLFRSQHLYLSFTHVHSLTHTCIHIHMHAHTHTRKRTHTHILTNTYTHTHTMMMMIMIASITSKSSLVPLI